MLKDRNSMATSDDGTPSGFIKRVLRMAIDAPGFVAVSAVFGIGLLVVTLSNFGVSLIAIGLGIAGTLLLSTLYLAFTWVAVLRGKHRSLLAIALAYTTVFALTAGVFLVFSSTFFDAPLPIKTFIVNKLAGGRNSLDIASLIKDVQVGATIQYAESKIGTPFYYDQDLRQYKLLDGQLEVFIIPSGGLIEAAYFEWLHEPTEPFPIFLPPYRNNDDVPILFGSATFGVLSDTVSLECEPVDGAYYQTVYYFGISCESRLGAAREPWYYFFGLNRRTSKNLGLDELRSANADISSLRQEVFNILLVTRTADPSLAVAVVKDHR